MRLTLPIKRKPPENAEIFLEALEETAETQSDSVSTVT
jgi:hypothetical protein